MKKLLVCLMITVFALSVFSAFALADVVGSAELIIETSDSTNITLDSPEATGTLNLTFKIKPSTSISFGNINFTVQLPENFSIVSTLDPAYNSVPSGMASFNSGVFALNSTSGVEISQETILGTAVVTIQNAAAKASGDPYKIEIQAGANLSDTTLGGTGTVTPSFKNLENIVVKHGPNGHTWGAGSKTKDPTCTEKGENTYTCNVCQATEVRQDIDPKGHQFDATNPAVTFTWSGKLDGKELPTATFKVHCTESGCEFNGGDGKELTGTVTESNRKEPTCEQPGSVDYKAVATITDRDGEKTYTDATTKKGVSIAAPGHAWGEPTVTWEPASGKPTSVTVMVVCGNSNCDLKGESNTDVGTSSSIEESGTDATCEHDGYKGYSATINDFDHATDFNKEYTKESETVPALGHKWSESAPVVTWEGDANTGTRTIQDAASVEATCDNGDKCDGDKHLTFGNYSSTGKPASCTEDGDITYTVTGTTKDGKKTYTFTDTKQTLTKLGHDFGENKPTVTWPGSVDGKNKPTITEAQIVCNRSCCKEPIKSSSATVNEVNTPEAKWKDATYLAPGKRTYTVSAVFPEDAEKGGSSSDPKLTDEKTYDLPKLTPPTTSPTVSDTNSVVTDNDTATGAVQSTVDAAVKAALAGGTPAGMDATFAGKIRDAGAGNGEGSEAMTVTTTLEVKDKGKTNTLQAPNNADDLSLDGVIAEQYCGIDIKVEVKGGVGGTVTETGYITQTGSPISFQFPVSDVLGTGPIILVARHHGGVWAKIPSTVSGGQVNFSSNLFSAFALASSNSIAYADVAPVSDVTYNGQAQTPKPKVTINTKDGVKELTEGEDYTLSYANNTNAGTADIVITAKTDGTLKLTGSQTVHFKINSAPAASSGAGGTSPNTGDETPLALYAGVLTLCAAGLAVLFTKRKKSR